MDSLELSLRSITSPIRARSLACFNSTFFLLRKLPFDRFKLFSRSLTNCSFTLNFSAISYCVSDLFTANFTICSRSVAVSFQRVRFLHFNSPSAEVVPNACVGDYWYAFSGNGSDGSSIDAEAAVVANVSEDIMLTETEMAFLISVATLAYSRS